MAQQNSAEWLAAAERAAQPRGLTVDAERAMERVRWRRPGLTLCEYARVGARNANGRADHEAFKRALWLVANGYWPTDFPQLVRCVQENKPARSGRFRPVAVKTTR
jgi:hypothetical protein